MTEMLELHVKVEDKLTDLEGRSRCENVRIYGVLEGAKKDSTTMVKSGENQLREGLGLAEAEDVPNLHRAHC